MDSQQTVPATPSARHRYFAVDLASLRADRLLAFDLYVYVEGNIVLYREKSLPFAEEVRKRLLDHRVKQVYIHENQRQAYLGYMEQELPGLLRDEHLPSATKAHIVYATSKVIAENVLANPTYGENLKRSEKLVEETVGFLTRGPESFRNLVKLSDTDYKLYSHSVNVCTFSLGLAQYVGVDDPDELTALGVGAMLHDVGKTKIDARIMRKRSPLSHAEFELMKKHVDFGVEILSGMKELPKAAFIPVMQHNEREDGSGYPRGLVGEQIHLFGKITAIADVFDALTTDRVFRKAFTAYDAFKEMLKLPLDQTLLKGFIALLGPDHSG
jgi:putative nucleotidyltransferase with HDIG domain